MTIVDTSGERDAILPRISDWAWAEKPSPPCSFEISIPRNPCRFTNVQISPGISFSLKRMCQSSIIRHNSSVGPSRNACSSRVSTIGGTDLSLAQSGLPENSSASKPTVPASSACCSVSDTLGRMPLTRWKAGSITRLRRSAGIDSATRIATGTQATAARRLHPVWASPICTRPDCHRSVATAVAAAHSHIGASRMASSIAPATTNSTKIKLAIWSVSDCLSRLASARARDRAREPCQCTVPAAAGRGSTRARRGPQERASRTPPARDPHATRTRPARTPATGTHPRHSRRRACVATTR